MVSMSDYIFFDMHDDVTDVTTVPRVMDVSTMPYVLYVSATPPLMIFMIQRAVICYYLLFQVGTGGQNT